MPDFQCYPNEGIPYLVTTVVKGRQPLFGEHGCRQIVIDVYGCPLALGLHIGAAHLGQLPGHELSNFALGGDGVAEEVAAPGLNGPTSYSLVAVYKYPLWQSTSGESSSRFRL